jgi:hypothetical protein
MRRMSKYSYIFESGKYGYFIYNAVTNSFVKIGKDLKERIEQVAVWDEEALAQFPKDFQNVMEGVRGIGITMHIAVIIMKCVHTSFKI